MANLFPLPCVAGIEMIQQLYDLMGSATAAALRRTGAQLARATADLEELQGPSEEVKPGVFVQRRCPFADAIKVYADQGRETPASIFGIAQAANKSGGAWVSAYCGIHQSVRQTKNPKIFQIACKSGAGAVNYAPNEAVTETESKDILKSAACVYGIKP
jgi:hypothetical protein